MVQTAFGYNEFREHFLKIVFEIIKPGETAPTTLKFESGYIVVGRKNANILLDDARCSQQHLLIYQGADSTLWMRDLESTNGTYVNGERSQECKVVEQDEIKVGRTIIRIQSVVFSQERAARGGAAPTAPAKEEQTEENTFIGVQKKKGRIKKDPGLVNTWPGNWKAAPQAVQDKFLDYVDENGDRTSVRISEILKKSS